jgi:hypothetical protein
MRPKGPDVLQFAMQPIPAILEVAKQVPDTLPALGNWRAAYREVAQHDLDFSKTPPRPTAKLAGIWTFEVRRATDRLKLAVTRRLDVWPGDPELRIEADCQADGLGNLLSWTCRFRRTRRGPAYLDFATEEHGTHRNGILQTRANGNSLSRELGSPLFALPCLLARLPFLTVADLPKEPFVFSEELALMHPDCRLRASTSRRGWLLTGMGLMPTEFVGKSGDAIRMVCFGRQRALLLDKVEEVQR